MNSTSTTEPASLQPEASKLLYNIVFTTITLATLIFFIPSFPFSAVLLKYRVNYTPKRFTDDGDGEEELDTQPQVGPAMKSYFSMFHEVLQLESWSGLYKGFIPSFAGRSALAYFIILMSLYGLNNGEAPPNSFPIKTMTWLVEMVFSIPFTIVVNRAITTHHKLPWFDGKHSLRLLLTERERSRPWLLYLTPGVAASDFLFFVFSNLITQPLHDTVFSSDGTNTPNRFAKRSLVRLVALVVLSIVSTTGKCLHAVVSARLSVQVRQDASENYSVEKATPFDGSKDVINSYQVNRPYTGLVDCMKRVVKEEGYSALFRAWWIDFVVGWWWLPFRF